MNYESILLEHFRVSPSDLEKAKVYQSRFGGRLEKLLVNMGSLSEESQLELFSQVLDSPVKECSHEYLSDWKNPDWASDIDVGFLIKYLWLPDSTNHTPHNYLTCDPLNWEANQYLLSLDHEFSYQLINKADFDVLSNKYLQGASVESEDIVLSEFEEDKLRELATEAPTVNLLNSLLSKGVQQNASDLHLEPFDGRYRVRYRIDGVLQDEGELPASMQLAIISRVKILANMDIAEKRRPQDGKIEAKIANTELDIRVSALPLGKGESIVLRFLRKDSVRYNMEVLGISKDLQAKIEKDLMSTSGVILLTGPTGSGKTTSLYTFLNELNSEQVKIVTLEDPIEYQLAGVNQVQINPDIGFDFASGLRSIVRQDPDVIMVGEIRDKETAKIALQSALTGHLVFSTLHTNDAPSAYTRLIDLGVEEFLLNAAIVSIIAQRLVRKVCPHCSVPDENATSHIKEYKLEALTKRFGHNSIVLKQPEGCEQCNDTGYKGRMSILEYMPCSEDIRSLKKDSHFIPEAKLINSRLGNRTLFEDGLIKACNGDTTIDEVIRVCA